MVGVGFDVYSACVDGGESGIVPCEKCVGLASLGMGIVKPVPAKLCI